MDWYAKASCRSHETRLFFSHEDEKTGTRRKRELEAKKICATCMVTKECLDAGAGEDGIWGGLTRAERLGASRHRVTLERPLVCNQIESDSPWVVIDTSENFSVWQRDSDATWHGSQWAVVKNENILKTFNDLNEAYIAYGHLLHS